MFQKMRVKSVDRRESSEGNPYLFVVWKAGGFAMCWETHLWEIIDYGKDFGRPIEVNLAESDKRMNNGEPFIDIIDARRCGSAQA